MLDKRKAMMMNVSHMLIGLSLLIKGIDKAAHFSQHPLTVVFLFVAGAFIILGTVFHHVLEKKIPNFAALFHVADGIALILLGFMLLEKSSRLPYFVLFIGVCYLGLGGFEYFTAAEARKKLRPKLLAVMAAVFLAAAAVAAGLNLRGSKNTWVFVTAGLLVAMAAFMLLVRRKTGE